MECCSISSANTSLKGLEIAQPVKCLLCKHENPCLIPKLYKEKKKNPGMVDYMLVIPGLVVVEETEEKELM